MQWVGLLVIAVGVYAVVRRVDVRLALLLTALVLGALANNTAAIVRKFLETFSNERFVVPICTAMGFAYVLKLTQCDQHLVHLLVRPLTRVRGLLIPGTVAVGFLVNIPIVSQTSTAVTLGAVVIPILLAARVPPVTIGAALLLGSSIGGELLNPGAPELRTVVEVSSAATQKLQIEMPADTDSLVSRLLPFNLLGLAIATLIFWGWSLRSADSAEAEPVLDHFQVNPFKAAIPLLPLVLLFLTSPPLSAIDVPQTWLVDAKPKAEPKKDQPQGQPDPDSNVKSAKDQPGTGAKLDKEELERRGLFDCRKIGAAMLIGVVVAGLSVRRGVLHVAASFFEGAGYAFTHIISLIVAANCFGEGVKLIGLNKEIGAVIKDYPIVLLPAAGLLPLCFGVLCGSGMASTQSLFGFFAEPALELEIDPYLVGSVVSLSSAAGRTLSPFAAVTLMCASLTKTDPVRLVVRLAPGVLAGIAAIVVAAMLAAHWP